MGCSVVRLLLSPVFFGFSVPVRKAGAWRSALGALMSLVVPPFTTGLPTVVGSSPGFSFSSNLTCSGDSWKRGKVRLRLQLSSRFVTTGTHRGSRSHRLRSSTWRRLVFVAKAADIGKLGDLRLLEIQGPVACLTCSGTTGAGQGSSVNQLNQ